MNPSDFDLATWSFRTPRSGDPESVAAMVPDGFETDSGFSHPQHGREPRNQEK
jgi:hypothetical protein